MDNSIKNHVDAVLSPYKWREEDSRAALQIMKGETKMRKRLTMGTAIALTLLMLTMALAVAEIVRYSVKDYLHLDEETAQKHITPIHTQDTQPLAELYMTDAVFDGQSLTAAMEIKPHSDETLLLVPRLAATANRKDLVPQISGSTGGDFTNGFLLAPESENTRYALDAMLPERTDTKVSWTLDIDILSPIWPIAESSSSYSDDSQDTAKQHDAWEKQFVTAYNNKQVLLSKGSMMMFVQLLPNENKTLTDRLVASGAFRQVSTLHTNFTTPSIPMKASDEQGKVLRLKDMDITIEKLEVSGMHITWQLLVVPTSSSPFDTMYNAQGEFIEFRTQANVPLRDTASSAGRISESLDNLSVRFYGQSIATMEMPKEITFTRGYRDQHDKWVEVEGQFTLQLP